MASVATRSGQYRKTLNDERLSNLKVDAQDEEAVIRLDGDAILENVSIKNSDTHPAMVKVTAGDGRVIIRDCYFENGADNAIFVHEQFSGTLVVERCYAKNFVEDFIYASPTGNPRYSSGKANPGGGWGIVSVIDCYSEDCGDYGVRIGSENSKAVGCVVVGSTHCFANLYAFDDGATFRDCYGDGKNVVKHIDHDDRNVGNWDKHVVTNLENVRGMWTGEDILKKSTAAGKGTVNGSVERDDNNPGLPAGVPSTAQEAASGEISSSPDRTVQKLNIDAGDEPVEYEFVGNASKVEALKYANVGDGDERIDERSWKGKVHGGNDTFGIHSSNVPHIDSLVIRGSESALDKTTAYLNGEEIDFDRDVQNHVDSGSNEGPTPNPQTPSKPSEPPELEGDENRLVVDANEWDGRPVEYYIAVTGQITKADGQGVFSNAGSMGRMTGKVWGGNSDTVRYTGELLEVSTSEHSDYEDENASWEDHPINVLVNGDEVDIEDIDPGGHMYWEPSMDVRSNTEITEDMCDVVAESEDEFYDYQSDADDGDIIGVTVDIELVDDFQKPVFEQAEVTVAGLKRNGTYPLLHQDNEPGRDPGDNTGIRFEGNFARITQFDVQGFLRENADDTGENVNRCRGIGFVDADFGVVDHCRVRHWSHAGVSTRECMGHSIYNVTSYENWYTSRGYGFDLNGPVNINSWEGEITDEMIDEVINGYQPWHLRHTVKRFHLDACRHDLKGGKQASYEVAYGTVGDRDIVAHRLDMHRPGGGVVHMHDITVPELTQDGMRMRGWAEDGALLERMHFGWGRIPNDDANYGEDIPVSQDYMGDSDTWDRWQKARNGDYSGFTDEVRQIEPGKGDMRVVRKQQSSGRGQPWRNMFFRDNHCGPSEPDFRCGAPGVSIDDIGEGSQSSESNADHEVRIVGANVSNLVYYEIDGSVRNIRPVQETFNPKDSVDGRVASGGVNGGTDIYIFESESEPTLNSAVFEGTREDLDAVKLLIDGEEYDFQANITEESKPETYTQDEVDELLQTQRVRIKSDLTEYIENL